jgi:asparagine synthase (glutamine-hydrolysing)
VSESEELLGEMGRVIAALARPFEAVAVAYSGGVDSSIIAALASRHARVTCYSACVPFSFDARNSLKYAGQDGFNLEVLDLSDEDIIRFVRVARGVFPDPNPVTVSYAIPCLCVMERATERGLFVGNVADEIFAGYSKYESVPDANGQMEIDLKKALYELNTLSDYAQKRHKVLLAPYAEEGVRELASQIPLEKKLGPRGRKVVLRDCARILGLKASDRSKKAAQYSSGTSRRIKHLARSDGKTLTEWIRDV